MTEKAPEAHGDQNTAKLTDLPPKSSVTSTDWLTRLRPFTGLIALVVLCILFGTREPAFVSYANWFNILNTLAIFGILAVGQAFPLIGGGFDLSQGAIASLCGVVVAGAMSQLGLPIPAAVALGLLSGVVLGGINGVLIAVVRINPFVATLGTQTTFFGLVQFISNNQPAALGTHAREFQQLAYGQVGPFSLPSILFLVLVVAAAFVLRLLPFGQHVYALGGNEEAARLAGIPTTRIKITTYALSGLLAAIGGLVLIARAGQASPTAGTGYELLSLASCIVGGVALGGGLGGAWNVLVGALTLGVLQVGLQMAIQVSNLRPVIQGLIILLAVAVDARARLRR